MQARAQIESAHGRKICTTIPRTDRPFLFAMTYLRKCVERLWTAASATFKRDTAHFSSRHFYFGLVAGFGFPLYYVIWHVLFPQPYETLPLRLVGSAIFVPIVLAKLWPASLKPYFPLYWYLALLFALPFFFTFMLLKNDGSTIWLLSTLVALFVMILLLDWINLLIHIALGVACAVLAYHVTTGFPARFAFESFAVTRRCACTTRSLSTMPRRPSCWTN